jgi:ubiquinone/menaquinone biosynthesis C-methylase UbiE
MGIYAKFAYFYAKGPYAHYGKTMAALLPAILERFHAEPRKILDLACGEGTFCVAMAKEAYRVTGVDFSTHMLELARERAIQEKVNVAFLLQDMRSLAIEERYDLVTCWYDSLNYLLEVEDLEKAFACAYRVLKHDGLFIFDMNTIYGLSVIWQRSECSVQQDAPALFEIHRPSYDFERNIATLRITGFAKEKGGWTRIDEEHKERGYALEEIGRCLQKPGFQELARWGNLQEMSEPKSDSGRIWFIAQR